MSAAHETPQEFWRPPSPIVADNVVVEEPAPAMAESCPRCGSEFLFGSHFCHTCGGRRPVAITAEDKADAAFFARLWVQGIGHTRSAVSRICSAETWSGIWAGMWNWVSAPEWLRYLHFHEIKSRIGLSTASLIAFMIGLGCVAGAVLVGLLTAKTFVDWQAIQFYRAEWLLGATAAFVAGILLKKPSGN